MAVRTDITVDVSVDPRIITVADPSTVLVLQDLVDTLRVWEDDPINMEQPKILDADGKDDLGGGLAVEITMILLNALVAFEARGGPSYVLCQIDGGNLTALNLAGDAVDPIKTTDFTQVVRTQASSSVIA